MIYFLLNKRPTGRDNYLNLDKKEDKRPIIDILFQTQYNNPQFIQKVLPGLKKAFYNDFPSQENRNYIDLAISTHYREMMNYHRIKEATELIHSWPPKKKIYTDHLSSNTAEAFKNDLDYFKRQVHPKLVQFIRNPAVPLELRNKGATLDEPNDKFDDNINNYLSKLMKDTENPPDGKSFYSMFDELGKNYFSGKDKNFDLPSTSLSSAHLEAAKSNVDSTLESNVKSKDSRFSFSNWFGSSKSKPVQIAHQEVTQTESSVSQIFPPANAQDAIPVGNSPEKSSRKSFFNRWTWKKEPI